MQKINIINKYFIILQSQLWKKKCNQIGYWKYSKISKIKKCQGYDYLINFIKEIAVKKVNLWYKYNLFKYYFKNKKWEWQSLI